MGRPPLPLGAWGKITVSAKPEPRKGTTPAYRARAAIRDRDGIVRPVVRYADTQGRARTALLAALANRQQVATSGEITGATKVAELARAWLEDEPHPWSVGTRQEYTANVNRWVIPRLGNVRLREATAGVVDDVLRGIGKDHGPSAAKSTRAVLNGMFGIAVRRNAITSNPVRDAAPIRVPRKIPRSLADGRDVELSDKLRSHERAVAWDLPDLVDWMLATGCRIGEALAIRDGVSRDDGAPLLDLTGQTWEVDATTLRVKGNGVVIQERTKSQAGWRRITVPDFAMEMLERRRTELRLTPKVQLMTPAGVIRPAPAELWVAFPSAQSRTMRDSSNTAADLREVLDSLDCEACAGTGYELNDDGTYRMKRTRKAVARVRCRQGPWSWITSHTFRKTVTTRLLRAGLDPSEVADHVGHDDPSMTLKRYAGRQVVSDRAAGILAR